MRLIDAPKGVLRLAALRLLSESSMSGTDLSRQMSKVTGGNWKPGPGSVYLVLADLLKKGLIAELPKREGNMRRYIVSSKGKEELARLSKQVDSDVARQLKLLSAYSSFAGRPSLQKRLDDLIDAGTSKD